MLDGSHSDHWINMRNNSESDYLHSLFLSKTKKSSLNPSILPKFTKNSFRTRNRRQAIQGTDFNFKDLFLTTPKDHYQANDDDRHDYIAIHKENATKNDAAQNIL